MMKFNNKKDDFSPEMSRLKRQVARLHEHARHNELVHNRFQKIELALLSAKDFYAIAEYLQGEFKKLANIDAVSLLLVDTSSEIVNALCVAGRNSSPDGILLTNESDKIAFIENIGHRPLLCTYRSEDHQWLFNEAPSNTGSLAVLRFFRRGKTIGCLALYSQSPDRYQPDVATEFLQRFGAITAICVENCLNYEYLRRLSLTDPLTGLANRRELEKRMRVEVSQSLRKSTPLSCLYLDVDYFKQVNDKYGHDVGDQVLKKVAEVMIEVVRIGDLVSRYGGEEFVILLPGTTGTIALETAERIRQAVSSSQIEINNVTRFDVTISIGLASFIPLKNTIGDIAEISEHLLLRADNALMGAKASGRNRVVVADETLS